MRSFASFWYFCLVVQTLHFWCRTHLGFYKSSTFEVSEQHSFLVLALQSECFLGFEKKGFIVSSMESLVITYVVWGSSGLLWTVPFFQFLQTLPGQWILLIMERLCFVGLHWGFFSKVFCEYVDFRFIFFPSGPLSLSKLVLYGSFLTRTLFFIGVCCVLLSWSLVQTLKFFDPPIDEVFYCLWILDKYSPNSISHLIVA